MLLTLKSGILTVTLRLCSGAASHQMTGASEAKRTCLCGAAVVMDSCAMPGALLLIQPLLRPSLQLDK